MNIKITGSGCYIPTEIVSNKDFAQHVFLNDDGTPFPHPNDIVAEKFLEITGIQERRYVTDDLLTSDIAFLAAQKAIENADVAVMDKAALGLAMEQGMPIVVFDLGKLGNISKVVQGESVGTLVSG